MPIPISLVIGYLELFTLIAWAYLVTHKNLIHFKASELETFFAVSLFIESKVAELAPRGFDMFSPPTMIAIRLGVECRALKYRKASKYVLGAIIIWKQFICFLDHYEPRFAFRIKTKGHNKLSDAFTFEFSIDFFLFNRFPRCCIKHNHIISVFKSLSDLIFNPFELMISECSVSIVQNRLNESDSLKSVGIFKWVNGKLIIGLLNKFNWFVGKTGVAVVSWRHDVPQRSRGV